MFQVYSFIASIEWYKESITVKLLIDIITQRITFKIFIDSFTLKLYIYITNRFMV